MAIQKPIPAPLLLLFLFLTNTAAAATSVSVVELGKAGRKVTRAAAVQDPTSSVGAVASFLHVMHAVANPDLDAVKGKNLSTTGRRKAYRFEQKKVQEPGMALVPDLFQRADGGVLVNFVLKF